MSAKSITLFSLCFSAIVCVSCSKETAAPESATQVGRAPVSEDTAAAVVRSPKRIGACEMVTQAEMSAILGGEVVAAAGGNDRPPTSTECIYSTPGAPDPYGEPQGYVEDTSAPPYAELEVDWGGGDVPTLGAAIETVESAAPVGAIDTLQGLGDRAYQVTADQVFISTEGDLMMIRFPPGTDDVIPKARKIYEAATAKY